ncbi:MAG: hypothetical protein KF799_11660 [Bdellovibrionales bacterium]|nr:hypothetical protein [Bdellovibrionales bacterium]
MDSMLANAPVNRPDIRKLMEIENILIDVASRFSLSLLRAPHSAYLHLSKSNPSVTATATKNLSELTESLLTCAAEDKNPWDDAEFFRISMRRMGLSYPPDFLDHVQQGDLIEGYDMNRIQIFRNMTFMQKSGYSLIEIMCYDWPTLFDRSSAITNKMLSYCDEILWQANRTIPFEIPHHFQRERQSGERLMWEVQFRHLAPLFSGPNNPFGLLGTCRVKPIDASNPLEKVTFV